MTVNGYMVKVQAIGTSTLIVVSSYFEGVREAALDYFMPVLLTDSWLERSGFFAPNKEESHPLYFYKEDFHHFYIERTRPHVYTVCLSDDAGQLAEVLESIEYLHELQNVFFELTGQELEVQAEEKT
jgi:hypothetical protein